jgi:poly-gamma-glutamate synthesis protein (capsule biosynthesis protein)
VRAVVRRVHAAKRAGDLALVSLHWGGNWGYEIARAERAFAHALIDAGIDLVHGHSSHHPKGLEVYGDRLILYGCGDFLNDYEGIGGYASVRAELTLMYLPKLDAGSGRLLSMELVPMRIRRLRLERACEADARWLEAMLGREGKKLGTRVERGAAGSLTLHWN